MKKSLGITLSSIVTFIFTVPFVVSVMRIAQRIKLINDGMPNNQIATGLEWILFVAIAIIWSIGIAGSIVVYKFSKTEAITAATVSLIACAVSIFAGLGLHYIIMMII